MRFDCDDFVHLAFNFGHVQASRPQVFTASTAIQSSWPPSSDVWKMYGDAMNEVRGIPSTKVVTSNAQNAKDVPTGVGDGVATKETSIPD